MFGRQVARDEIGLKFREGLHYGIFDGPLGQCEQRRASWGDRLADLGDELVVYADILELEHGRPSGRAEGQAEDGDEEDQPQQEAKESAADRANGGEADRGKDTWVALRRRPEAVSG